jgi:hypothetical protein
MSAHTATFSGILKKRYTDFLANAILPRGEVLAPSQHKASPVKRLLVPTTSLSQLHRLDVVKARLKFKLDT